MDPLKENELMKALLNLIDDAPNTKIYVAGKRRAFALNDPDLPLKAGVGYVKQMLAPLRG